MKERTDAAPLPASGGALSRKRDPFWLFGVYWPLDWEPHSLSTGQGARQCRAANGEDRQESCL